MYDTLTLFTITILGVWLINRQQPTPPEEIQQTVEGARITQLWSLAQSSMRENNYLQAEKALLTILNLDSQNAAAYNRIGILYAKQKEYKDAMECFMAAFNLDNNASSLHNLGLVYFNLEQYEKASLALKQALELDNKSALRYIEYAKVLERLGRNKEVLDALEKAAQLEPKPEILNMLLTTYISRKMYSQAEAVKEKLTHLIVPSSQQHLQRSSKIID